MRGRYKVNVVNALINQLKVDFTKPFFADFFAETAGADFMVLAVNALHVAAAEKHCTGATVAAYARLFPKMDGGSGDFYFVVDAANADLFTSVNVAVSWAKGTFYHGFFMEYGVWNRGQLTIDKG